VNEIPLIEIVSTGVANTASVIAAFKRLGANAQIIDDRKRIELASHLVLPGVGSFGHAMQRLQEQKMIEPLRDRILDGRPTLAICLGMQLFCASSDESPGVAGLGIIPANVRRFQLDDTSESNSSLRVPHLGWNSVSSGNCRFLSDGQAYFAHSYCIEEVTADWNIATANYGGGFVAALERQGVLACQFHPELSGEWGQELVAEWISQCEVLAC
jgi:imidazole glycerol phosphate synthase glutamine amidotransferase subunit